MIVSVTTDCFDIGGISSTTEIVCSVVGVNDNEEGDDGLGSREEDLVSA